MENVITKRSGIVWSEAGGEGGIRSSVSVWKFVISVTNTLDMALKVSR